MAEGSRPGRTNRAALIALLIALVGCSSEGDDDAGGAAGGASGAGATAGSAGAVGGAGTGGTAPGGAAGAGAGTAGAGGAGATATGGAAGVGASSCAGSWGAPEVLYQAPDGYTLSSPAVRSDDLELFYVDYDAAGAGHYRRTARSDRAAPFTPGDIVSELDAACGAADQRMIDLSSDGRRAYIVCIEEPVANASGALRMARRPDFDSPFSLDAMSYGVVGASPAISADELRLYTSAQASVGTNPSLTYMRASTTAPFGAGMSIPGLESSTLSAPDISPDGLALFGNLNAAVVVVTRSAPDAPFGGPSIVVPGDPMNYTFVVGAADVSGDCRSLYYVHVDYPLDSVQGFYALHAVRR